MARGGRVHADDGGFPEADPRVAAALQEVRPQLGRVDLGVPPAHAHAMAILLPEVARRVGEDLVEAMAEAEGEELVLPHAVRVDEWRVRSDERDAEAVRAELARERETRGAAPDDGDVHVRLAAAVTNARFEGLERGGDGLLLRRGLARLTVHPSLLQTATADVVVEVEGPCAVLRRRYRRRCRGVPALIG